MPKLTIDYIRKFVEENSKCKLLSTEYLNNHENLKFICECGNTFERNFNNFQKVNLRKCPKCNNVKNIKYTIEDVRKFVNENSDCELISKEYIDCKSLLEFRCSCGKEFKTCFDNFSNKHKRKCNDCVNDKVRNERNYSFEEVKNFIEVESKSDCKLLSSKYVNVFKKMKFQCKCGQTFITNYASFKLKNQRRCKHCSSSISIAEFATETYLNENNYNFVREFIFEDCKDVRPLPFDFYFPEYRIALEIDGTQHYKPSCFGGISLEKAKENLKINKKHDKIKNNYCENNNIKLIRIPYWDFNNIEQILESVLP